MHQIVGKTIKRRHVCFMIPAPGIRTGIRRPAPETSVLQNINHIMSNRFGLFLPPPHAGRMKNPFTRGLIYKYLLTLYKLRNTGYGNMTWHAYANQVRMEEPSASLGEKVKYQKRIPTAGIRHFWRDKPHMIEHTEQNRWHNSPDIIHTKGTGPANGKTQGSRSK